jgi:hypothetical protein
LSLFVTTRLGGSFHFVRGGIAMMPVFRAAALTFAAALVPLPCLAQNAPSKPLRHLVYGFHWGTVTDMYEHNSGFGSVQGNNGIQMSTSGTGLTNYSNHAGDEGTITVDVMEEQPDKGLVVSVSEEARDNRSAKAATCVVYGNGNTICDPSMKVNPEEYSLVRFLGVNFVDSALIDAKSHWQFSSMGPNFSATSDYTITHNVSGAMTISEQRSITFTGSRHGSAVVVSTIGYDVNRTVPTALDELTTERVEAGIDYQNIRTQMQAKLQSDSLAVASQKP